MIFTSDRRKRMNSAIQPNMVMKEGRKKVEVDTLLLGNDKNKVIDNKVLSYFKCLSSSLKYMLHISGLL